MRAGDRQIGRKVRGARRDFVVSPFPSYQRYTPRATRLIEMIAATGQRVELSTAVILTGHANGTCTYLRTYVRMRVNELANAHARTLESR